VPTVAEAAAAWALLAWQMLKSGQADAIELIGEGLHGRLTPAARFRVWRRPGVHCGDPHAVDAPA